MFNQQIRMDHEQIDEVKRRTRAGWSAFGNLNDIMRSNKYLSQEKGFQSMSATTTSNEVWIWNLGCNKEDGTKTENYSARYGAFHAWNI